ncbi:(2Fe-2S)-binding protein [Roseovarius sp. ZX-A-9]|uniref:(2Fe-2S)-binding protein n=1 Tax=Roseovarius sp. ZX-A-9 TaxID=3014783 RepID=UPI00232C907F|nr:(2Fe-2S)-binding protein [Roseovarius sp. ZX-A-9]
MAVTFTLNGQQRRYSGDPRTSLMDALRCDFRLTGTKDVCGEGFCGACLVHIDGVPKVSCLLPIGAVEGADVTTIEGVGDLGTLNPVQQAFEDFDVVQCGMCFPGMVMTLSHFLQDNPRPSRDEVKSALVGNICRCTGYERIIDAVMSLHNSAEGRK